MPDPYELDYSENRAGTFGSGRDLSKSPSSTFVNTPGNIQETKANGDVVNYKPYIAAQSTAPRLFNPATVLGPPPGTTRSEFGTDMRVPSEIAKDPLQSHRDTLKETREYYKAAAEVTALQNEAQSQIHSANYLAKNSQIDPASPDFEKQMGDNRAENFMATGSLVQDAHTTKHTARAVYLEAMSRGGASEFGEGTPEFQAYVGTKGDLTQKRAAAMLVKQGEADTNEAVSRGLIAPIPPFKPEWADPKNKERPAVYNPDGTKNYSKIRKLAAAEAGSGGGVKGQQTLNKSLDVAITTYAKLVDETDPSDPKYSKYVELRDDAIEQRHAGMQKPAPGPTPTPAGGKPATRTRGGFTYQLQPDGTYK